MFSHVMIGTNDLEKAKAFYDALLGTLDVRPAKVDRHRIFYFTKTGTFSVSKPINGQPTTPSNGGTIGFMANSPEQADAWHAAGVANGATSCEDPPGIREGAAGKLYLAYLRDASDRDVEKIVGWVRRSRNPPSFLRGGGLRLRLTHPTQ